MNIRQSFLPSTLRHLLSYVLMVMLPASTAAADLRTPLEASDFQTLPKNAEILEYLDRLAGEHQSAKRIDVGVSATGDTIGGLLISPNPAFLEVAAFRPELESERLRLMLISGQHGEETAGPEALQIITRELLSGELQTLADDMDIIVVANASPDGRDLHSRVNSAGVNINTDYILLTQPESQSLSALLTRFRPDAILDIHESPAYKETTLAKQGYATDFDIQYEIGFEPNIDQRLRNFGVKQFLPALLDRANRNGLNARRYILEIHDIDAPVTHGGITLRNFRNYSGASTAFSTLVEGRIDPPGGGHPTPDNIRKRTRELAAAVRNYVYQIHAMRAQVKQTVAAARESWRGPEADGSLVLKSEYAPDSEQEKIEIPLIEMASGKRVKRTFDYHGKVKTIEKLQPPPAYLIKDHQEQIAALLQRHGVAVERLTVAATFPGTRREITHLNVTPPLPERHRFNIELELDAKAVEVHAKPGDLLVSLNQPQGRLVPLLLEPMSSTSIYQEPGYARMLNKTPFFIVPLRKPDESGSVDQ